MKDELIGAFERGERLEGGIRTAVGHWCADPAAAKQLYGPIASWNTGQVRLYFAIQPSPPTPL